MGTKSLLVLLGFLLVSSSLRFSWFNEAEISKIFSFDPKKCQLKDDSKSSLKDSEAKKLLLSWTAGDGINKDLQNRAYFKIESQIYNYQDHRKICNKSNYVYEKPSSNFLNVDNNRQNLVLGSFVQSKNLKTASENLLSIPLPKGLRKGFKIGTNKNYPCKSTDSTGIEMKETIFEMLKEMKTYGNDEIMISFKKSSHFKEIFSLLEINEKMLSTIGVDSSDEKWDTRKSKMIFMMLQDIASFYVDVAVKQNPFERLLTENFNVIVANLLRNLKIMGKDNPPLYVDQVTYGRILLISVDESDEYLELENSVKGKQRLTEGQIQVKFTKIFHDPSAKILSVGPNRSLKIEEFQSGEWGNFFMNTIGEESNETNLSPLAFKLRDMRGNEFKTRNQLQYEVIECKQENYQKIQISLSVHYGCFRVQHQNKEGEAQTIFSGSNKVDITNKLGFEDQKIKVRNTCGGFRGRRYATLTVWVDGKQSFHKQKNLYSSQSIFFTCTVNKIAGKATCNG